MVTCRRSAERMNGRRSTWRGSTLCLITVGTVEFVCNYTYEDEERRHHELASFARHDGAWYFVEGEPVRPQPFVRTEAKIGRNDPCPCGSGKKYKDCHQKEGEKFLAKLARQEEKQHRREVRERLKEQGVPWFKRLFRG